MKKTDLFINCESLSYDHPFSNPDFLITDTTVEDLLFLSNLGYNIVIEKGKCTVVGTEDSLAKLIAGELKLNLSEIEEYHELSDYIRFKCWSDAVLADEVRLAVREAIIEKAYDVKFIDIFEYIVDSWVLDEKEKEELWKQDAEDLQEQKHPDAK